MRVMIYLTKVQNLPFTQLQKHVNGDYKEILSIFRGGQPWFHDPFEDKQMKVLFSSIDYDSATGAYEFILVEVPSKLK